MNCLPAHRVAILGSPERCQSPHHQMCARSKLMGGLCHDEARDVRSCLVVAYAGFVSCIERCGS